MNVLFLCTANSARSQMAEGFARRFAPPGVRIYSAGTEPTTINPSTIAVMQEAGVDTRAQRAKSLDEIPAAEIDLVITLCGDAAESCPVFPHARERRHWPLRDPAAVPGSEEERLRAFREVRDEIRERVRQLCDELAAAPRA